MPAYHFAEVALLEGATVEAAGFTLSHDEGAYTISRTGSLEGSVKATSLGGAVRVLATMASGGTHDGYVKATNASARALLALAEDRELRAVRRA
jgi:hypothetical protein